MPRRILGPRRLQPLLARMHVLQQVYKKTDAALTSGGMLQIRQGVGYDGRFDIVPYTKLIHGSTHII